MTGDYQKLCKRCMQPHRVTGHRGNVYVVQSTFSCKWFEEMTNFDIVEAAARGENIRISN